VSLEREFIPTVLELLPQQHIALGRLFPLFRLTIARQLINDTCLSNAAYSFSTGLAEIIPVLDLPLNLTDLIILTKSQAFLVYKLGLLLGFTTRWQDYVTEFGGVIGSGFVWRQIARSLIGLVPGWGIIPKVAIAYSGTYVVGNAILGWYLSGRHLTPKQMRALSAQAFARGKEYARKLGGRIPKPRLGQRKKGRLPAAQKKPELMQEEIVIITKSDLPQLTSPLESADNLVPPTKALSETSVDNPKVTNKVKVNQPHQAKRIHINRHKQKETYLLTNIRTCSQCGKTSSPDARFCQYCGFPFDS
jgi:uncharacterized protein (DUF697 family)